MLTVEYPCANGGTAGSLSKASLLHSPVQTLQTVEEGLSDDSASLVPLQVVLKNRQDCCKEQFLKFRVRFMNHIGSEDRPTLSIGEVLPEYTIAGKHMTLLMRSLN